MKHFFILLIISITCFLSAQEAVDTSNIPKMNKKEFGMEIQFFQLPFGNVSPFGIGSAKYGIQEIQIGTVYKGIRLDLNSQWHFPLRHQLSTELSYEFSFFGITEFTVLPSISYEGYQNNDFSPLPSEFVNKIMGSVSLKFLNNDAYLLTTYGFGWFNLQDVELLNPVSYTHNIYYDESDLTYASVTIASVEGLTAPWQMKGTIRAYFSIRSLDGGITVMRRVTKPSAMNKIFVAGKFGLAFDVYQQGTACVGLGLVYRN